MMGPAPKQMEVAMTRIVLAVLIGVLCPAMVRAQAPVDPTNPVSETARTFRERYSNNLIASAELMPPDKYAYHPTEAQMTFGQLMAHVVQTNEFLCSAIAGTPTPPPTNLPEADKDALVKAVKESFDRCTAAFAKLTDGQLADPISMGRGGSAPRAFLLMTMVVDWADHYSTAASYLRLNGLLPPSARPPQ
jgi:uncharacterized damage-inducible protein DinB